MLILVTPEELRMLFTPTVKFRSFQNGVEVLAQPTFFIGPSSLNLHYQLIDTAPGTVLVGSTLNDFIVLQGGGNKAVDGGLGDDVIDGGTGSTFVSGGGGSNTFFLDGRAPGVSWSTITDFRLGVDFTTIWGWKAGVSRVAALEANGGAAGYSGLTLHFENLLPDLAPQGSLNQNLNSITFSHMGLADFGVASLNELNAQIATGASSHFTVGETNDIYGQHGYLFIS
jgi:Ca2+-binding RTX toxin-like protein